MQISDRYYGWKCPNPGCGHVWGPNHAGCDWCNGKVEQFAEFVKGRGDPGTNPWYSLKDCLAKIEKAVECHHAESPCPCIEHDFSIVLTSSPPQFKCAKCGDIKR